MLRFQLSTTIERPLAEVFAFWSDPDNLPRWQDGLSRYQRLSPAPAGVGTAYTAARRALGMDQETRGEYTAFESNKRYTERITAGPSVTTVETRFTDLGGRTRVDVETAVELGGALGRLGEKIAAGPIRRQAEDGHARIKKLLEGG